MNISGQIRSVRGHRRKPLMYVHVNITEADQPERLVPQREKPHTCLHLRVPLLYLCVLEVVSPQRSDLVLTANIPNCEADVLVFDCLHVKA